MKRGLRAVITGGGTGGHIYPALAIAEALKSAEPRWDILFVGTRGGMEAEIVPRTGLKFKGITAQGIRGKRGWRRISALGHAVEGFIQSLSILRSFKPNVVVGTGGYASGPVVLGALMLRIPSAIQEQNVIPGTTNKVLSRWVDRVFLPFEESEGFFPARCRKMVTGNPLRGDVTRQTKDAGAKAFGLDPRGFTLLALGGSRGAEKIVESVTDVLIEGILGDVQVILITGNENYSRALERLGKRGISPVVPGNIILRPYIHDMADALAASDLVVARAGGMMIAELSARGLPSVLIPSPNVVGNHQHYNAQVLTKRGAAVYVKETRQLSKELSRVLARLVNDPAELKRMATESGKVGRPNASEMIAREIARIAKS